jgi:Protein of unknown function (DUF3105)
MLSRRLALAAAAAVLPPALLSSCHHEESVNPVAVSGAGAAGAAGGGAGGGAADGGQAGGAGGAGGVAVDGEQSSGGGGTGGMEVDGGQSGGGDASGGGGDAGGPVDAGPPAACDTVITAHAVALAPHVPVCSPIDYATNPPTSGPHYPIWAVYRTYAAPVPRGYWVHSLEHGAIVISYNCTSPCDAELAELAAYLDARPADPLCAPPVKARIIVTPDPRLDVRFAASAWGFSLRSSCFDLSFLDPFINAHYARTPENFCSGGIDPTDADAGVPAGCGEPPEGGDGG